MKKSSSLILLSITLAYLSAGMLNASLLYMGGNFQENFNTLPTTTGTAEWEPFTWAQNSTLEGWRYRRWDGVNNSNGARTNGNSASAYFNNNPTNRILSLGAHTNTDRALGLFLDGGRMFLTLVNDTGATLTEFTLSFTGEQWINNSSDTGALRFAYSVDASDISNGTYNNVSQLDYTSTVSGGSAEATNNTNSPLGTTGISHTVTGLNWDDGEELWLRWTKDSNNHLLAIDDLAFTAIPEPSTLVLVGIAFLGALGFARRRL